MKELFSAVEVLLAVATVILTIHKHYRAANLTIFMLGVELVIEGAYTDCLPVGGIGMFVQVIGGVM